MTRPPANPSVAMTASSGSKRWAANLLKSRLPESRTASMEGICRKAHSCHKGHGVHRVAEVDGGPIGCRTFAQHVGEGNAPKDNELSLQDAVVPLATAFRRFGVVTHRPVGDHSG